MVKLVLIKNVKNLGTEGEEIEVKDGYARNFLLPRELAVLSSDKTGQDLITQIKKKENNKDKTEHEIDATIAKLTHTPIVVKARANQKGKLYKAISRSDIAEAVGIESKLIENISPVEKIGKGEIEITLTGEKKVKAMLEIVQI